MFFINSVQAINSLKAVCRHLFTKKNMFYSAVIKKSIAKNISNDKSIVNQTKVNEEINIKHKNPPYDHKYIYENDGFLYMHK